MENNRNGPSGSSRSRDKGKQPMIEEEIPESSGTKVNPFSEFVYSVESTLWGGNERYAEFRQMLNELRSGRNIVGARSRIEEILQEHQVLLTQFRTLFPGGEEPPPDLDKEYEKALQLADKVEEYFGDDELGDVFLTILTTYWRGNKNPAEMYDEMKELFKDNPDLLQELLTYLPSIAAAGSSRP